MMLILVAVVSLLGLTAGSGVRVVADRMWVEGQQRLGGRCALVELTTAVLFVAVALRLSALHQLAALPLYLYFVAIGVALTLIDLDCKRLPNALVLPSYPVVLLLLGGAAIWRHDGAAVARALIGASVLFGLYFALASVSAAGMGFGDVKLAGLLGIGLGYLSYTTVVVGAFTAFLLGAVVGLAILVSRRGSRTTAFPFGPCMLVGALLAMFASGPMG